MANELQLKYRSPITAQESAAILSGGISGGVVTTLNNSEGAQAYQCYVNVTEGPTSNATARLYCAGAYTTAVPANYDSGSLSCVIPAGSTGEHSLGIIYDPDKYVRLKLGAEDYGFTASLVVVPILAEAQ